MAKKFTSTIVGASIFISILMLLGRGFGFIREIVYAGYFGIGEQFDLYLVSAVFPITVNTIVYYLGQNYFIPAYNKVINSNAPDSSKFLSQIFLIFIAGGILLSLCLAVFSDFIIAFYLHSSNPEIKTTASTIFIIFLTTIPIYAGISILSSYLQAKLEYTFPALSRLFLNISIILLILLFSDDLGIYVIPVGYATGVLIQFIYLLVISSRFGELKLTQFQFDKVFLFATVKSSVLLIILIESISQLYLIADRFFYSDLPGGGIASLNYAYNLFIFPIAIFSFAITTAIFPRISDAFVRRADTELTKVISESVSASLVVFTPITFIFLFHTEPIIKVIFERGNFSAEGTTMTAEVLQFYGLSLIFYSVYTIMNKILYSTELVKQLLLITTMGIIIKLAFNFILVGSMKQGGLALGTTLSYTSFLFFSFILIHKQLKFNYFKIFFSELSLNLINALISYIIASMLINTFTFNFLLDEILFMVIFVGVFFLNLTIQKHPTVATLLNIFQRFKLFF